MSTSVPPPASPLSTPTSGRASQIQQAAPAGIGTSPSTLMPAAQAESPSCLSQIGSMISSIVSSIFSLISSLWNCVTGGTSQVTAPAAPAQTPAEVLSAHAQRFFDETVSRNIQQNYPHKVALLIKIDGQRTALFTRDLPPANTTSNPLREFCSEGMQVLGGILRQNPSLTSQSTVELSVADIRRHSEPESRNPNAISSYNDFLTTLSAADNFSSFNHAHGNAESIAVHRAARICAGSMFANRSPDEDHLHTAFMYFVSNHANATTGWTLRAPVEQQNR